MNDKVICAEGLGKRYLISHRTSGSERYTELRDVISLSLKGIRQSVLDIVRGGQIVGRDEVEEFWALKDVNFEIKRGDAVGIVGRNGAGKSTLLKILSRITEPSAGRVQIKGRVASLLEVGTGFHPELTGRENIYLNGSILGMSRTEIKSKFDEIVAFAEVEKFLDTPVKRYSSGMYVRLAFAVAAHLEQDILIVDEVLAVGDANFQRKCLGKMGEVGKQGRTVLFVSHNLSAVRNFCSRGMLFEGGTLRLNGDVADVIAAYERSFKGATRLSSTATGPLVGTVEIESLVFYQRGQPVQIIDAGQHFEIELRTRITQALSEAEVKIEFFRDGALLASCFDTPSGAPLSSGRMASRFRFNARVFKPGMYMLGVGVSASDGKWLWVADASSIEFSENLGGSLNRHRGLVELPYDASRSPLCAGERSEEPE